MKLEEIRNLMLPVVSFREQVFVSASGSKVTDTEGNAYIDLAGGQFCTVLGHSNPEVADLVGSIARTIQDTDTSSVSQSVLDSALKLRETMPEMNLARFVYLSTGAEAGEFALRYSKFIRKRSGVISFSESYHGQTHGTAAYSMSRDRIRPPVELSFHFPMPNPEGLAGRPAVSEEQSLSLMGEILDRHAEQISCFLVEPILSGAGVISLSPSFAQRAIELAKQKGLHIIFDECQTGFGRTGNWYFYQELGVVPDFLILGKAIGLGWPVAVVAANGSTIDMKDFEMRHFSSHQNEPFAGEIISFGVDYLQKNNLIPSIKAKGDLLRQQLLEHSTSMGWPISVRGHGLMVGFDLGENLIESDGMALGPRFLDRLSEAGILAQTSNYGRTIRLLPDFLITDSIIGEAACAIAESYATMKEQITKDTR